MSIADLGLPHGPADLDALASAAHSQGSGGLPPPGLPDPDLLTKMANAFFAAVPGEPLPSFPSSEAPTVAGPSLSGPGATPTGVAGVVQIRLRRPRAPYRFRHRRRSIPPRFPLSTCRDRKSSQIRACRLFLQTSRTERAYHPVQSLRRLRMSRPPLPSLPEPFLRLCLRQRSRRQRTSSTRCRLKP